MNRYYWLRCSLVLISLFCMTKMGLAENSSRKIFSKTKHDFGTVARGSKAIYEFEFRNPYDNQLVVDHVRSSCGCTKASIKQTVIEPNEKGKIVAEFNTRSFLGKKSATVTVAIRRPVRTEIQLRVTGNIRGDIVFDPGEIEFQNIRQGETKSMTTEIHYAGSDSWKIVDIKSSLGYLVADLKETQRGSGSVKYELTITMNGKFPTGLLRDQLTVITNDTKQKQIPLSFSAQVSSPLSVSPSAIEFASQQTGKRRLIFKADKAFQFQQVTCNDKRVEISYDQKARKTHLVSISYTPVSGTPTPKSLPIKFVTDLGNRFEKTIQIDFE